MWTEIETTPWDHNDPVAVRGQRVMQALRRFEAAEAGMRERSARAMHVTENELLALRYVIRKQREGVPVKPTDVSHYLQIKTAAVTIMIDHLERAGHLVRMPHPSDRRSIVLQATPEAQARIEDIFGAVYHTMMGVARQLGEEDADHIVRFLDDVSTSLDGFVADQEPTLRRHTAEALGHTDPGDGSGHALAS